VQLITLILSVVFFIQPSFSAPASKKITCPEDGIGAKKGDAPLLSSKTPKGSLVVCGYHEEGFYSEFDIYSEANGKYSKSLYRAHALQNFKIEPFEGGVNLTEFIYFRDKQVPFQKLAMNCNIGDTCSISRATCEKEGFVPFKTDILKRIHDPGTGRSCIVGQSRCGFYFQEKSGPSSRWCGIRDLQRNQRATQSPLFCN